MVTALYFCRRFTFPRYTPLAVHWRGDLPRRVTGKLDARLQKVKSVRPLKRRGDPRTVVRCAAGPEELTSKAQEGTDILKPLDLEEQPGRLEVYLQSWEALPSRIKLLISAFLSFVICNMDKVNISVAIIPMAQEFGWNATVSGLVQSAFFYGYMLCQLPGGYLSTRFTGSRMLPIGVGLWSAATFGLPIVGGNIQALSASRGFVGVGEALAPAAVADVIAKMVPPEEKSRAVVFVNSGLYLGTILGLLTSPVLIDAFGWHSVFYVFGGVGLMWVVTWELLVNSLKSNDPATYERIKGRITPSPAFHQLPGLIPQTPIKREENIPWRGMLRTKPIRAVMFHFSILAWLPTYFSSNLGLDLGDAARISLVPPIAGMIISSFAGPAADALISRGWRTGVVRKLAQCTAFTGPSLCLLGSSFVETGDEKVVLMTAAIGLGSFCLPGLYSNGQDLSPKYAGFILSLTTTFAALPGIIGVPITGAILDATNSWPLALFAPSIFFMMSGALIFGFFGAGHEIQFPDNRPFPIENRLKKIFKFSS